MSNLRVKRPFRIVGTGVCFPSNKVTSEMLEAEFELPTGWSVNNSGVGNRYHAKTETIAGLGAEAIAAALVSSGIQIDQLGMIICGSATYDYPLPNQASIIKSQFNGSCTKNIPCVDIKTTCLGFITALDYASRVVDNSKFRYIAIVCSEIASKGLNPANRETLTLFGDGAAAAIIAFDESGESGAIHNSMYTYSEGVTFTEVKGGGTQFFFKDYPYDPQLHSFSMDGIKLLRLTKRELPAFIDDFFSELPVDIFGVDHIIPHQASRVGLHVFYTMYNIEERKRHGNLHEKGNCISASIPMVLDEVIKNNLVKRGDSIFLCGTSAGFALGGLLIRY
ncbi:MAG: hypothetical protein OEV74_20915 [Cyclobacteriaceae bacterium]|nr:hypothetical protein [Cyclobacteriaceae bacterium]MDH4298746.1 hypothetical protein [Cyclobacteriaceae bacterium]MDH5249589.1 hypothetical protein [Cyclobacteriaceae bacterium]